MACDWVNRKIYWLDSETKRLEVVSLDKPRHRKVLVYEDLDMPMGIALAPSEG